METGYQPRILIDVLVDTEDTSLAGKLFSSGLTVISLDQLFDGSLDVPSTGFHTDTSAAGSYLKIDLGSGNEKAFVKGKFYVNDNVVAIWDIQYSDDDSTWITCYEGLDCSGGVGWKEASWTMVDSHRYWRFFKTNPAGTGSYHTELKMYFHVAYRYATNSLYDPDGNFYKGTLLNLPTIKEELIDIFWGRFKEQTITLELSNRDGEWHTLAETYDLRGCIVLVKYYDILNSSRAVLSSQGFPLILGDGTEIFLAGGEVETWDRGKIIDYDIREMATITVELRSYDVLSTILPLKMVNTTDWPYATDLGQPVNIMFGYSKNVPLRYIHYETGQYDYLVGYGPIHQIDAVYRNGILINSAEYTVYRGDQTTPYPGYAVVQFTVEQRDFTGTLYQLTADVNAPRRNFASAIQQILENRTYGLSQSVDDGYFQQASELLGGIGDMHCDGAITTFREARDIIDEFLFLARARLKINAQGEWCLIVDQYGTSDWEIYTGNLTISNNNNTVRNRIITGNVVIDGDNNTIEYVQINGNLTINGDNNYIAHHLLLGTTTDAGSGNQVAISRVRGHLGFNDGYYDNVLDITHRGRTDARRALKSITLRYGQSGDKQKPYYENTRSILGFGMERIFETAFVQDHITADKITSWLKNLFDYADEYIEVKIGIEDLRYKVNDVVEIEIPAYEIDTFYKISSIEKGIDGLTLRLNKYSSYIFKYNIGVMPSNAETDANTDYTIQTPTAPS